MRLIVPVVFEGNTGRPESLDLRRGSSGSFSSEERRMSAGQRGSPLATRQPIEHTDSFNSANVSPVSIRSMNSRKSIDSGKVSPSNPEGIVLPNSSPTAKKAPVKPGLLTRVFKRGSRESLSSGNSGSGGSLSREMPLPNHPIAEDNSGNRVSAEAILQRPPAPLPVPREGERSLSESSCGIYDKSVYSRVEQREDRSEMLAAALRNSDTSTKCECGLELEDSELPRGWSIHISHEENTKGRIFFEAARGQTSWNLPLDISLELSLKQQEFIRKLLLDVRAGKLPPPAPHGEPASADTTGNKSGSGAGAFNNSHSSSSGDSAAGRGASAGGPVQKPTFRAPVNTADSHGASAEGADQNSNIPDKYLNPGKSGGSGDGGTWC